MFGVNVDAKRLKQNSGEVLPRFLFSSALTIFAVLSLFVHQYVVSYVTDQFNFAFSLLVFLIVVQLFFAIVISILGIKTFKRPFKVIPLILAIALIMASVLGTFIPQRISPPFTTLVYTFAPLEKAYSFLLTVSTIMGLYIIYNFGPLLKHSRYAMFGITYLFIFYALSSAFISFFTDAEAYTYTFVHFKGLSPTGILGIHGSKDSFANVIFIGMMAEMYLLEYSKSPWRWIFVAFFGFLVIFSGSKTLMILAPTCVFAYLVRLTYDRWKKGPKKAIPYLIATLVAAVGALTILFYDIFFLSRTGFYPVEFRFDNWNKLINYIFSDPLYALFGVGDFLYGLSIAGVSEDFYAHGIGYSDNGWIEILGRGGLIRLMCYAALLIYIFVRIMKAAISNRKDAFLSGTFFTAVMVRTIFSVEGFFDTSYESIAFIILIVVPVFSGKSESRQSQKPGRITFNSILRTLNNGIFYLLPGTIIPLAMIGYWKVFFLILAIQALWIYIFRFQAGDWIWISVEILVVDLAYLLFGLYYLRTSSLSLMAYTIGGYIGCLYALWSVESLRGVSALPLAENIYLKAVSAVQRLS